MREVRATVLENIRLAEEVYSLTFSTGEAIPVRAGQFCMIYIEGTVLRRPIAVCTAEGDRVRVCYRLKGEGTRRLAGVRAGEALSVLLPLGNGFFLKEEEKKIALVGGGVGIFPLISAIREYAGRKQIFAYTGFRNANALCMRSELERSDKWVVASDDGSVGFHGTAVQAFLRDCEREKPDAVLACGPLPMLRALKEGTKGRSVPVFVSLEERMGCGVGACLTCVCNLTGGAHARVCKDGPVFDINRIEL